MSICFQIRDGSTFFKLNSEAFLAIILRSVPPSSVQSVPPPWPSIGHLSVSVESSSNAEVWPFLTQGASIYDVRRYLGFFTPPSLSTKSLQFVRKFAAFLDSPPSLRTSFMGAPTLSSRRRKDKVFLVQFTLRTPYPSLSSPYLNFTQFAIGLLWKIEKCIRLLR